MTIDVIAQVLLELEVLGGDCFAELHQRRRLRAHVFDVGGAGRLDRGLCRLDEVRDDVVDHPPHDFVDQAAILQLRIEREHRVVLAPEQRHVAQAVERDQSGAQAVVDVVIVVRDLVGEIRDLRFEAGLAALDEALAESPSSRALLQRAVLEDSLAGLERQVQPGERRVALLELVDDAQRLQVVLEAAVLRACNR